ncbi:hypothetical protein DNL40_08915 [Xylanimonas oleitrophica]|uniref:Serine aminopeptidase S33 domain-containing protein n=1 Tax=Xylanimonas oleitrophica TaxID=2607479 RepID=A0A2W5Y524_9MICO|nr:hypothetical protein DNL40_08915 [Xylanimonas oleitrophica]
MHVIHDPSRAAFDGGGARPVRIYEWRAPAAEAPLVVLSHGTGGGAPGLAWWAQALCTAGFDVVALDHHGNSYLDDYVPEAFVWWWDRALDVTFVLDHVTARGPAGVGGFSIGGYTAAAVCGVRVRADRFEALMTGALSVGAAPEYPGLADELQERYDHRTRAAWAEPAAADLRDPRVSAAFLLCPAAGPLLDEASLAAVEVPVAVRWTAADRMAPPGENGVRYAALIPGAEGGTVGSTESGHYGFVLPEHDDPQAKADVAEQSVDFFRRTLMRHVP